MRGIILSLILMITGAEAACTDVTADAANYLKHQPDWQVLQVKDLAHDDQDLWQRYTPNSCPGIVQVDFDGSGRKFTVLNLLSQANGRTMQQTVALRGTDVHVLRKAHAIGNPTVLYVEKPGTAKEWDSQRRVVLAHESVSIVQMEASAEQFYLADGKFQSIWTSD